MKQNIQNGICNLEHLFALHVFRIPQYQRAYSWEKSHLEAFLEDLRQQVSTQNKTPDNKQYFLGTLLLHEEELGTGGNVVNIVDGQQRMTTSVVFIATALKKHKAGNIASLGDLKPAVLHRHFVRDEDTEMQKFHTIIEDEPFFQSGILGISSATCEEDSPSSRRLREASDYFAQHVKSSEWGMLLRVLTNAKVMVYGVTSAEDATQIFELQNDRGKKLTSLEALKSFLMHCIYLHSTRQADDRLAAIQAQFAKIYRTVELLADLDRTPEEDQILAYHCAAFLQWREKEYNDPKQLIKAIIKGSEGKDVIAWIEEFVSSLVLSFKTVGDIFSRRDSLLEIAELLVLGRMGSFWPLVMKAWRFDATTDKKDFLKTCRLIEVFAFRGYAIAGLRSDSGLSTFYTVARDFAGDFDELFKRISATCLEYDLEQRFEAGLNNSYFYNAEGSDALYLLWRYENSLREEIGNQAPLLSWRDFVEPRNYAAKFSVEHVAARENPISDTLVQWSKEDQERPFHEVALNRLGNLVIDSISSNAAKGKQDFSDKLGSLANSIYLSQSELTTFLTVKDILIWDIESIKTRHERLVGFALKTWNPSTWYKTAT